MARSNVYFSGMSTFLLALIALISDKLAVQKGPLNFLTDMESIAAGATDVASGTHSPVYQKDDLKIPIGDA